MSDTNDGSKWWREAAYLARYAGSGILNTLVGFFVIFSAMAVGVSPLCSNIFGYFVGFILGFVVSKKFVFRSNGHFVAESIRYLFSFIISFFLNFFVLYVSLNYFLMHAVISQVMAAISYTFLMYVMTRLYVFRP